MKLLLTKAILADNIGIDLSFLRIIILLFDTLAILDQVSNTEGVSYTVFITALAAILGSFIATIGVLTNMVNARMIRIEDKLDRLVSDVSKTSEKTNESLFLIKASLGIITVVEKPSTDHKKEKSE